MKRVKCILWTLVVGSCILFSNEKVCATENSTDELVLIEASDADKTVIPDVYNTGCEGELTTVNIGDAIIDSNQNIAIQLKSGDNNKVNTLGFYYSNKEVSGTIRFENFDFSKYDFKTYHETMIDRNIHVIFNNCKFSKMSTGKAASTVSYEFNNCTFNSFYGSNATLNHCEFGRSFSDGIVPFINVSVNDCFFTDMASEVTEKAVHIDGTQLYGADGIDVENVHYTNCRFEIPALVPDGSSAYVNACIMLQLEFSNGKDISFNDCIVNGGGYSIYAHAKGNAYTFENVSFDGIRFGSAKRYGVFYPDVDSTISIKDVGATDSLYIGSVWKEDGVTHLSVTNDTKQERTLQIYTDQGTYTHTISGCPAITDDNESMTYDELPFDIDITIPEDCQYVVCYDTTLEGCGKQIRFVNWGNDAVYLTKETVDGLTTGGDDVLLQGTCGASVTFTLTNAGVLTLSGTGATYSYHSAKSPEWSDYIDYIKEIRVEEGIESLGSMIFRNCNAVQKISLPDTLTTIGTRAISGCSSLSELTLPANLTTVGASALSGTLPLANVYYEGDNWNEIDLGGDNDMLDAMVVYYHDGTIYYRINYVLNDTEAEPATHSNPATYEAGSSITFENPVREGYTFDGWYTDADLTKPIDCVKSTDAKNFVLYAKWTQIVVDDKDSSGTTETADDSTQTDGTLEAAQTIITFKKNTVTLKPGKTANNIAEVKGDTSNISYTTSNSKVATVSSSGIVKGVNAGKATITATTGSGDTYSFTVKVSPKKVKSLKVKKKSNTSVKISWKKDKNASGYQIAIKTGSKGKYKIVKTIKKNKTISYTKKKLKRKKTYYVKVRAYKVIDGKKVYGDYCTAKKIKLK